MSLQWSLIPLFLLSSAMVAWARWPRTVSRLACWTFAGLFFGLGVLGMDVEGGPQAALGVGVLYMLIGLPLASVTLALSGLRSCITPAGPARFMGRGRVWAH
ncbi:hypothetical protein [Pusillimonas noertemannii]|uniref:Uncharacterized protein n=1 Tax=Pusillimonas noertemannii TaxID=305977 RepID=A0A2U1CLU9_9BURK|nr:hypothetical protein [Pusillimonas noertemannii]NYT69018.1 hypothetical protein [Pusillimonas noertemannii]PVY61962.1 hypothetical protein C7440_1448 [Pusillimonas noertemannii]TFL11028.1 hypothetical protein CSC72_11120 [Pusillimonas noertemannii]